jgi:hypothetical protein
MINMNIALPQIANTVTNTDVPCNYMITYTTVGSEIARTQSSPKHPTLDMCEPTHKYPGVNRSRGIYSIKSAPLPKTVNPYKLILLKSKNHQHQGVPSQVSYCYSRVSINMCKAALLKFISLISKITPRSASRRRVHSPAYGARCRQCSCGQSGGLSWLIRQWAASTGWPSHEAQPLPFAATSPQGNLLGDLLGKPSAAPSLADTRLSISPARSRGPWAPHGNHFDAGTPFGGRENSEGHSQGNAFRKGVVGRSGRYKGLKSCKVTRKRQMVIRSCLPPICRKLDQMTQIRQNRQEKTRGFRKTYHRPDWPPPDLTDSAVNQVVNDAPDQNRYAATKSSPDLAVIYKGVESKEPCQFPVVNRLIYQSKSTSGSFTPRKSKDTQYRRYRPDSERYLFLRLIPTTRLTG